MAKFYKKGCSALVVSLRLWLCINIVQMTSHSQLALDTIMVIRSEFHKMQVVRLREHIFNVICFVHTFLE